MRSRGLSMLPAKPCWTQPYTVVPEDSKRSPSHVPCKDCIRNQRSTGAGAAASSATDFWASAAPEDVARSAMASSVQCRFIGCPSYGLPAVERQVQREHVHTRLAEDAEPAPLDVPLDEPPDRARVELARARDASDLVYGRGGADVRVEADGLDRDKGDRRRR